MFGEARGGPCWGTWVQARGLAVLPASLSTRGAGACLHTSRAGTCSHVWQAHGHWVHSFWAHRLGEATLVVSGHRTGSGPAPRGRARPVGLARARRRKARRALGCTGMAHGASARLQPKWRAKWSCARGWLTGGDPGGRQQPNPGCPERPAVARRDRLETHSHARS